MDKIHTKNQKFVQPPENDQHQNMEKPRLFRKGFLHIRSEFMKISHE